MPQASDELRAKMEQYFGDPISDEGPVKFLESAGWMLHADWTWSSPGKTMHDMTDKEYECVSFLFHEWDFGGVR